MADQQSERGSPEWLAERLRYGPKTAAEWRYLAADTIDDLRAEVERLAARVVAALAARPQPDEVDLVAEFHEALHMNMGRMDYQMARTAAQICVDRLAAVAGSATPTQEDDDDG